jgi:hypothetical protein
VIPVSSVIGVTANYTISYVTKTVRTNFGCSGISEFGPTSESLVNEVTLPDGSYYEFTYEPTPGYSGDVTGRVASVRLPTGGTISYTYTGGNNSTGIECADGSTSGLQRTTPDTSSSYWSYSRTLGSGAASTTTITDPPGNETVLTFQGIYETERQVYQGSISGTLLKTRYTCYNGSTTPCNSTAITLPITGRAVTAQLPPSSSNLESERVISYNTSGLVTEKDEYAYGSGAPGSIVRKTLTSYASLGNGIVDMPATVTIENSSGTVQAETTYTYDQTTVVATSGTPQHVSISGSRGNATTIQNLVSGSTSLTKTFTYYDTGNVDVATDVNGGTTTYNYSSATATCGNAFASSISEAVSPLSKSFTWNCMGGVQLTSKDENSQTTTITYSDPDYWRPASSTDPLNNQTIYYYQPNPTYSYPFAIESSMTFSNNSGSSIVSSVRYLDSLGRTLYHQQLEEPGGALSIRFPTRTIQVADPPLHRCLARPAITRVVPQRQQR